MSANLNKLAKYASAVAAVLKVLRVLVPASAAVAVVLLLVGIGFAQPVADYLTAHPDGFWALTSGVMSLKVSGAALTLTPGTIRWLFGASAVAIVVLAALTMRVVKVFAAMMGDLRESRPFSAAMTGRVRQIAALIFVYAIVTPLIPLIPTGLVFVNGTRWTPDLLNTGGVLRIGYQYDVNTLALVAALMVLLLSLVFDYGTQLQQQADETL